MESEDEMDSRLIPSVNKKDKEVSEQENSMTIAVEDWIDRVESKVEQSQKEELKSEENQSVELKPNSKLPRTLSKLLDLNVEVEKSEEENND